MNMFCSKCKQNPLPAKDLTASLSVYSVIYLQREVFEKKLLFGIKYQIPRDAGIAGV